MIVTRRSPLRRMRGGLVFGAVIGLASKGTGEAGQALRVTQPVRTTAPEAQAGDSQLSSDALRPPA